MDLSWQAYVDWCCSVLNMRPEEAVERASVRLEKQTGKGLTEQEKWGFLKARYRINPYKNRRF